MSAFLFALAYRICNSLSEYRIAMEPPRRSDYAESAAFQFREVFMPLVLSKASDRQVLLMFDEFEALEDEVIRGRLEEGVFMYLRSLMQHTPNLDFIFTGAHRIKSLTSGYFSVLFNIGVMKDIGLLDRQSAVALITSPVEKQGMSYDDLAVFDNRK